MKTQTNGLPSGLTQTNPLMVRQKSRRPMKVSILAGTDPIFIMSAKRWMHPLGRLSISNRMSQMMPSSMLSAWKVPSMECESQDVLSLAILVTPKTSTVSVSSVASTRLWSETQQRFVTQLIVYLIKGTLLTLLRYRVLPLLKSGNLLPIGLIFTLQANGSLSVMHFSPSLPKMKALEDSLQLKEFF